MNGANESSVFCGGLGTRLREFTDTIPKPMVNIGDQPILWHLMKYYAHFGTTNSFFALVTRRPDKAVHFMNLPPSTSNDLKPSGLADVLHFVNDDNTEWKITFADTGANTNIGQRLLAVKDYLGDDDTFLANYSDGLSDLPARRLPGTFSHKEQDRQFCLCTSKAQLSYCGGRK